MQRANGSQSDFVTENLKLRTEIDTLTKNVHYKNDKMAHYQKEIDALTIEVKKLSSERKLLDK